MSVKTGELLRLLARAGPARTTVFGWRCACSIPQAGNGRSDGVPSVFGRPLTGAGSLPMRRRSRVSTGTAAENIAFARHPDEKLLETSLRGWRGDWTPVGQGLACEDLGQKGRSLSAASAARGQTGQGPGAGRAVCCWMRQPSALDSESEAAVRRRDWNAAEGRTTTGDRGLPPACLRVAAGRRDRGDGAGRIVGKANARPAGRAGGSMRDWPKLQVCQRKARPCAVSLTLAVIVKRQRRATGSVAPRMGSSPSPGAPNVLLQVIVKRTTNKA